MKNFKQLFSLIFFIGALTAVKAQDLSDEELLNMSLDDLMDIEIVNVSKLNLENLSEVPSVVTIVSAQQIQSSGAKNMEEVMRMVPGFDVIRNSTSPVTSLGVRGLFSTTGSNNKVLFLVDDHPVRSTLTNDANVFLANFPVNTIKQIEVIRGPGSTLFGAGAALAVINIRTKEAAENVDVSVTAGSFNSYEGTITYTNRINDDFSFTVNGSYYTTDGADQTLNSDFTTEALEPLSRDASLFGPFAYAGGSASRAPGQLNYGRNTATVNLKADFKDFYLRSSYLQSEDQVPVGVVDILTDNPIVENTGYYAELGFRKKLIGDKAELLVKGYMDTYSFDEQADLFPAEAGGMLNTFINGLNFTQPVPQAPDPARLYGPGDALFLQQGANNSILGGEFNFAYTIGNSVNLLAGAMYEKNTLDDIQVRANANYRPDAPLTVGGNVYLGSERFGQTEDLSAAYPWLSANDRDIYAVFGQGEFNLKNIFKAFGIEHLRLVAGVRYDDYSDVGGKLNPRAALLFAPTSKVYFKGLYGQAFRAPSFVELYNINSSVTGGNPDLRPETIRTVEGVIGYKVDKRLDVNLTYFNTEVTDNIQLVDDGDPTSFFRTVYQNIGDIRSTGFEAELNYLFGDGGFVMSSVTVQNVLDVTKSPFVETNFFTGDTLAIGTQEEFDPGTAPGFIFNLGVNYPINRNVSISVNGNHLAQRNRSEEKAFDFDASFNPIEVQADTRPAIPARTIVNATVSLKNFDFAPKLQLQLSGYNLLNADNFNPTLLIANDDLLRAGVNWAARLSYEF